jgi:hypothetical protein
MKLIPTKLLYFQEGVSLQIKSQEKNGVMLHRVIFTQKSDCAL